MALLRRCRALPGGPVIQRPPNPGDPTGDGVRTVVPGPGSRPTSVKRSAPSPSPTTCPPLGPAAARRQCSTASRRSADGVPGSPMRSSRWPTGPEARPPDALIGAVFVDCLRQRGPRPAGRRRVPDAALRRAPGVQHRLVRREAPAVPGRVDRPPGRARHGQRPGRDGRPADLAVGRFRHRGGLAVAELRAVAADMAAAAEAAGVDIVTGDTKVVERGAADGHVHHDRRRRARCPAGRLLGADLVQPGDCVIVSGTIADHGMAVMLARGDLALEADLRSDTAPLGELMRSPLTAAPSTRWMRDPTRGGVGHGVQRTGSGHQSGRRPRRGPLACATQPSTGPATCLGIDPLYVANEGKFIAVVGPDEADAALAALRAHPLGRHAAPHRRRSGTIRPASSCCSPPSAAPGSSTCWSAIPCPASADGETTSAAPVERSPAAGDRAPCKGSGSGPSCTATPSPWVSPGSCATTAPGC